MENEQFLLVEELDNNPKLRRQLRKKWDDAIFKPPIVPRNDISDKNTTQQPTH
jgi:hypothetical protein